MSDDEVERDSAPVGDVVVDAFGLGFEDWSPFDEIQEDFKPGPVVKVTAADGLPTYAPPLHDESDIPVLSPDTLTCMGDFSKFVLRGIFGDVVAEFDPADVERSPSGRWRASKRAVMEKMSLELQRVRQYGEAHELPVHPDDEQLLTQLLGGVNPGMAVNHAWIEVFPVRPPCRHYARQLTQFELNAQAKVMLRVCAARRTTEGAFMSLRDRAMWACELREPHAESSALLDDFDTAKMQEGARREHVPIFSQEPGIFGGEHGGK